MKVTLYAIAKNEEKNLEKFIENSKKFSHTVVVDTGSIDKTVELLRDAGIEVYEHPQTREEFDFSKARNQALSYVKTDWAFSLDFNEELEDFFGDDLDIISKEFTEFKYQKYTKKENEEPVITHEKHARFHRTLNYKWINSVHEFPVFVPTDEYPEEVFVDTTIKIIKNIKSTVDKELFYLSICEREFGNNPSNIFYLWFIFKHYYEVKNADLSLKYGQEYLNLSKSYFDYTRIDVFIMCSILFLSKNDIKNAANYAFHALSESMNMGEDFLQKSFNHLLKIGIITKNPNIIVFASGFSDLTLRLQERTDAIDRLFLTNLNDIPTTSWSGHSDFAQWLVSHLNPETIVDLGVHYGYSTFSFAIPRIGHVYGIDNFIGDDFIGRKDDSVYEYVLQKRKKLHLDDNIDFIKGDFEEVSKTWDKKIDILHIDGSHHYEDVKRDFETWSEFLKDDGVILMHDVSVETFEGNEYGVKKFFDEIDLPKCKFEHSFGLGIVSKNENLINEIKVTFNL